MKLLDKMHKYKAILSYCFQCRKNTKNIEAEISGTSNGKIVLLYVVVKNQNLSKKGRK